VLKKERLLVSAVVTVDIGLHTFATFLTLSHRMCFIFSSGTFVHSSSSCHTFVN
jgi:hypothetical protein